MYRRKKFVLGILAILLGIGGIVLGIMSMNNFSDYWKFNKFYSLFMLLIVAWGVFSIIKSKHPTKESEALNKSMSWVRQGIGGLAVLFILFTVVVIFFLSLFK